MTTYFGQCDSSGNPTYNSEDSANLAQWSHSWNKTYTCPGSGSQTVTDLSVYLRTYSGGSNVRVGIYNTSNALVAQGASEAAIGGSYGWVGHQTQGAITPNPATLTGGASYKLGYGVDNGCYVRYQSGGTSGDSGYLAPQDYTGGLPDPLVANTAWSGWWCIRCGVDPAETWTPQQDAPEKYWLNGPAMAWRI